MPQNRCLSRAAKPAQIRGLPVPGERVLWDPEVLDTAPLNDNDGLCVCGDDPLPGAALCWQCKAAGWFDGDVRYALTDKAKRLLAVEVDHAG